MENRKPAGRPFAKYEKPQAKNTKSIKPEESPAAKYDKLTGKETKSRRPAGKSAGKDDRVESRNKKEVITQIRLNRFIANSGVCSRRDADEHIKNGLVTVNGNVVTDMGTKVTYDDDVRYRNKKLSAEKKVYILMNKPKDYVTTVEDPHAEHTVLDLIGEECRERVYPVGRLDKATTGVLLLTNDGDLAGKLTHPKYQKEKDISCLS